MRRTWTIIGVADVARSLAWYQTLLGLPKSAPAHDHFGQIRDADGTVLLCLHQWGIHGHPPLTRPDPPPGTACCCSSGLMISTRRCRGRALWYPDSRRSCTGTRARQRWNSPFEIRMVTT
jgi:hypothetical protein